VTIILKPEQEQVIIQAVNSGLADNADDALDKAFDALRARLPHKSDLDESVQAAALPIGIVWQTPWSVTRQLND